MDQDRTYEMWIDGLRRQDETGAGDLPAAVLAAREQQRRRVPAWAWIAAGVVCVARAAAAIIVLVVS